MPELIMPSSAFKGYTSHILNGKVPTRIVTKHKIRSAGEVFGHLANLPCQFSISILCAISLRVQVKQHDWPLLKYRINTCDILKSN